MAEFFNLLLNPDLPVLVYLKILCIFVSVILSGFIMFFLLRSPWVRLRYGNDISEFFTYEAAGVKESFVQWSKIVARLDSGREEDSRFALIEADNLLGKVLDKMGYAGETTGEKLQKVNSRIIPNLDQVLNAHDLRNTVVYNPDYKINVDEARRALSFYEQALRDLDLF